jgi:cell division protein FtsB
MRESRSGVAPLVFVTATVLLGLYFSFASVQGDYGLFRRLQIEAEAEALAAERDRLRAEVAALSNRTRRMSDDYLDLDLVDEQARSVLGLVRADEVVIP